MKKYQAYLCFIWATYAFGAPPVLIKLKPHMNLESWELLVTTCIAIYGSVTMVAGLIAIGLHAQIWRITK